MSCNQVEAVKNQNIKLCANCYAESPPKKCPKCFAHYCGKDCQLKDWQKSHKICCKKFSKTSNSSPIFILQAKFLKGKKLINLLFHIIKHGKAEEFADCASKESEIAEKITSSIRNISLSDLISLLKKHACEKTPYITGMAKVFDKCAPKSPRYFLFMIKEVCDENLIIENFVILIAFIFKNCSFLDIRTLISEESFFRCLNSFKTRTLMEETFKRFEEGGNSSIDSKRAILTKISEDLLDGLDNHVKHFIITQRYFSRFLEVFNKTHAANMKIFEKPNLLKVKLPQQKEESSFSEIFTNKTDIVITKLSTEGLISSIESLNSTNVGKRVKVKLSPLKRILKEKLREMAQYVNFKLSNGDTSFIDTMQASQTTLNSLNNNKSISLFTFEIFKVYTNMKFYHLTVQAKPERVIILSNLRNIMLLFYSKVYDIAQKMDDSYHRKLTYDIVLHLFMQLSKKFRFPGSNYFQELMKDELIVFNTSSRYFPNEEKSLEMFKKSFLPQTILLNMLECLIETKPKGNSFVDCIVEIAETLKILTPVKKSS